MALHCTEGGRTRGNNFDWEGLPDPAPRTETAAKQRDPPPQCICKHCGPSALTEHLGSLGNYDKNEWKREREKRESNTPEGNRWTGGRSLLHIFRFVTSSSLDGKREREREGLSFSRPTDPFSTHSPPPQPWLIAPDADTSQKNFIR